MMFRVWNTPSVSPRIAKRMATEVMAGQPEILDYANHIADRFDLRRDIQFNMKVTSARFDEKIGVWTVSTEGRRFHW